MPHSAFAISWPRPVLAPVMRMTLGVDMLEVFRRFEGRYYKDVILVWYGLVM